MQELVVHGLSGSPFVSSVLIGLAEKRLPHRYVRMPFGTSKSPENMARQPFGRVPSLEHGDFHLYETQAILRYIDQLAPEPVLQPADARARARMNQVMGINDWYLFPRVGVAITFPRIVAPLYQRPVDEAAIVAALPAARVCIGELDRLLGGGPFFGGEAISLADILVVPQLDFAALTQEARDLMAPTGLAAWLERMRARDSLQTYAPSRMMQRPAPAPVS